MYLQSSVAIHCCPLNGLNRLLITPHIGLNGNDISARLVQQNDNTTKCLHAQ